MKSVSVPNVWIIIYFLSDTTKQSYEVVWMHEQNSVLHYRPSPVM